MAKITSVQASHTYGILDPHVAERRDTKFVGASLADGENIVILPQGGYQDRGATRDFGRIRRALTNIAITEAMLAMPNGGTVADLAAGTATATGTAAGADFVICTITLPAAATVHFFDIKGIAMSDAGAAGALRAEYNNGAGWVAFGAPIAIDLTNRDRRIATGAPGHGGVTAAQFRLVLDATGEATGTVTLSGVGLASEGSEAPVPLVRCFAGDDGKEYELVLLPGHADVYSNGIWKACFDWPVSAAQLASVKLEQEFDTLLGFHVDLRPLRVTRMGADAEWSLTRVTFTNLPLVDYGGIYTNGVNEQQEIRLFDFATGAKFELILEGQTTTAIEKDGTWETTAASIKAALEALTIVDPGLTVTASSGDEFLVEFTGGANAERNWLVMTGVSLSSATNFVRVRTIVEGKSPGEPIISDSAGWPAVGRFEQERLVMGGLKKRPNDILCSVTGDPYNFDTSLGIATAAFSYTVDFNNNNEIRDIIASPGLVIFGDQQAAWLREQALSATEQPRFGVSDTPGIKAVTRPATSDNALFYVERSGATLHMLNYTALEENYVGDNASILSAHLIRDPVDLVRRRATSRLNADLMMMVNADGTMTVLTMMRTQEVSGFAPWRTDGKFRSVAVSRSNKVWLTCTRQKDGVDQHHLEQLEPDGILDQAQQQTVASAATVSGLGDFEGRAVWVVAQGSLYGPHVVTGGELTLDSEISGDITIGTFSRSFAKDQRVSLEEESGKRESRLKRICRSEIRVLDTTSLAMEVNGAPAFELPLRSNAETITDTGPLDVPFSGLVEVEGMHGFTRDAQVTLTQLHPGSFTLLSLKKDVVA